MTDVMRDTKSRRVLVVYFYLKLLYYATTYTLLKYYHMVTYLSKLDATISTLRVNYLLDQSSANPKRLLIRISLAPRLLSRETSKEGPLLQTKKKNPLSHEIRNYCDNKYNSNNRNHNNTAIAIARAYSWSRCISPLTAVVPDSMTSAKFTCTKTRVTSRPSVVFCSVL